MARVLGKPYVNHNEESVMKYPVIEASECILCEVCTTECPSVFKMTDLGYVEIIDLTDYPEDAVNSAIRNCPKDCIFWQESK